MSEIRPIDANALKEEFKKIYRCAETAEQLANNMEDAIDNAPIVEERPNGKWVKSSNMSKRSYQRLCSNCKHIVYFCGDGNYPNCPYCLADMRGDV